MCVQYSPVSNKAEAVGILHPKLRRGQAIVNRNTLIYVLINLRALARLRWARAGGGADPRIADAGGVTGGVARRSAGGRGSDRVTRRSAPRKPA